MNAGTVVDGSVADEASLLDSVSDIAAALNVLWDTAGDVSRLLAVVES